MIQRGIRNKMKRSRQIHVALLTGTFILIPSLILLMNVLGVSYECTIWEYFGVYCAGCGATRMAIEIMHLNFYQAFRYNEFIMCTIPYVAYTYVKECVCYIRTGDVSEKALKKTVVYAVLLILFGIVRNMEMFNWLQPTEL